MTKEQIKKAAEDSGWSVYFSEQNSDYALGADYLVEFSSYTSFGQNVVVPIMVHDLNDVPERVKDYYDDFDIDEEAALWIGNDGHGKNGAPYHISAIIKDMEEAEGMIEDLAIALAQV